MEDNFSPNGQPSPRGKLNQKTHDLAFVNRALGIDEAAIDTQVLYASLMSAGYATPPGREVNPNSPVRSSFVVHPVKFSSSVGQSKPWCRIQTPLRLLFDVLQKSFAALPAWLRSFHHPARARKTRTTVGLSRPENQSFDDYQRFSA